MTMETINEVSAKCYCPVSDKKDSVDEEYYPIKCRKGINSLFEKLKIGLDKYLVDPGEANAYGISIPCETVCFKTYLKDGII
ncbi:MAG TPA: hypothetical protein VK469_25005 [Candidatus Kapabacteria bacterium]|nr:hypothetical protein [Candidatus Kapabacteria bacterium]